MKFNKLAIIFLTLSLCGCSKDYNIEPNKLPIAHIGKEYNQTLKITGGRVIPQSFEVKDNFPSDMNISIEPIDQNEADAYNNLKISGVPKHKGTFTINIYASFYAGGDDKLNKTYEFVVKE